jgi:tetratricopeptide (TPR) repeat protein
MKDLFSWLFRRAKKQAPAPVAAPVAATDVAGAGPVVDATAERVAAAGRVAAKVASPIGFSMGVPVQVATPSRGFVLPALVPPAPARPAGAEQARMVLEALLANGQFKEAEALIARLPDTLDDEVWLMEGALRLFVQLRYHGHALQVAPRLREAAPESPWGYLGALPALRKAKRDAEADELVREALVRCPDDPDVLAEGARLAEGAGDMEVAVARWQRVVELSPGLYAGYLGLAQAGFQARLHEVVAQAVEGGLARFPQDQALRLIAARHSSRVNLWDEARQHWDLALAAAPNDARLALEAATSLIGPPAGRQERLPEVIGRLADINRRFADFAPGYTAHLDAVRESGRLEEAAALGVAWRERFPADRGLWIGCARVAEDRGKLGDAIAILAEARQTGQTTPDLEAAYVRALSLAGQDAEAEQVCGEALGRLPAAFRLIEQHVVLPLRRGNFEEAARRAARWRGERPQDVGVARLADRVTALVDERFDASGYDRTVLDGSSQGGLAALFVRFESLGATFGGCEFGTVQRHFGAEPIGLLRWGNMQVAGLSAALQARFAGLGEPQFTTVLEQDVGGNACEYFIADERYHFWAHTFIRTDEAPRERVYRQTLRRLVFLRDKLIEDLENAEKIFVFKLPDAVSPEEIEGLFTTLRTYGPATLLCVSLADEDHPGGTVEMLRPGLFMGRVTMWGSARDDTMRGIDFASWREICAEVARRHDGLRAGMLAESVTP